MACRGSNDLLLDSSAGSNPKNKKGFSQVGSTVGGWDQHMRDGVRRHLRTLYSIKLKPGFQKLLELTRNFWNPPEDPRTNWHTVW